MIDLKALEADLATLQEKVNTERARVRHETLQAVSAMLESGTLTTADLYSLLPEPEKVAKPRKSHAVHPPVYRDPVSGNTWSGKGNIPAWIKDKNRNEYLIKEA